MRKKRKKSEKHNIKIAILFVVFVCLVILISFIFKLIHIVSQSKFDGSNRFTISVSNKKNLEIISFSPSKHSISVLKLEGEIKELNMRRFLAIPIDGFVEASFLETNEGVASLMSNTFFGYKDIETNLTTVDIFRLFLISRTASTNDVVTLRISLSQSDKIDQIIGKMLSDERIEKEDQTIEIINATSAIGLGARLARLITNMGGKVVQVSTENSLQKTSMILYNGRKTYTVEKLNKALGFKLTQLNKQSIGDITIVIGDDSKNPASF